MLAHGVVVSYQRYLFNLLYSTESFDHYEKLRCKFRKLLICVPIRRMDADTRFTHINSILYKISKASWGLNHATSFSDQINKSHTI
jgi:hypothetical protein